MNNDKLQKYGIKDHSEIEVKRTRVYIQLGTENANQKIQIDLNAPVSTLKKKIQEKTGIKEENQFLWFGGGVALIDSDGLHEQGVSNGGELNLALLD